nr:hypothetical protein [uncultured Marinobacter sp.]
MKITDETLSAFLDAELPEPEMQAVRARVQVDPALADRLAALAAVDDQLAGYYSAIDSRPLPDSVARLLSDAQTTDIGASGKVVNIRRAWHGMQRGLRTHAGLAVAAMLVMALGVAQLFTGAPGEQWQTVARALETSPSGIPVDLADGRTLTPRLTFRNQTGDYCRQFRVQGSMDRGQASENIACRSAEAGWERVARVELAPEAVSPATGYQTASGGSVLDDTLDRMISGDIIAPQREQQLIAEGWVNPE